MKPTVFKLKLLISVLITTIVFVIIFLFKEHSQKNTKQNQNQTKVEGFDNNETDVPQLNYIGCYLDERKRHMISLDNYKYGHTLEDCRQQAVKNGYNYYAIQDAHGGTTGQCVVSNDLNRATSRGEANNCYMEATTRNTLGGVWSNAIYSVSTPHVETYDVINNTNYPKDTIDKGPWNYTECSKKCDKNPHCVGFVTNANQDGVGTYPYNGTYCWLKKALDPANKAADATKVTFQQKGYQLDPKKLKYIGCYNDNKQRTLPTRLGRFDVNQCIQHAIDNSDKYDYLGLQDYHKNNNVAECWLGRYSNDYKHYGVSKKCNHDNGGGYQVGGPWINAVYEIL